MSPRLSTIDGAGHQLQRDAAAAFRRAEQAAGRDLPITSAYRTAADQRYLYDGYVAHRSGFNFALPPSRSNHCKGIAIDVARGGRTWLARHGREYGWQRDANEGWHFNYVPSADQHCDDGGAGGTTDADDRPHRSSTQHRILSVGSVGSAVEALQRGLDAAFPAYAKLVVDGRFGKGTAAAVKEFQRRSGLTADGVVGPATRAALRRSGVRL
ncbi:peptidoglycan-binding protein [Luteimicrobium subarcticum]|uniref:D-alanyl-D-alanine carboxypeptidase-like protein n=1 Tax=Luteimicrobium subarcticum TaxID=620910 RepID=A0A2M8WR35_9MICO|nr:peptidoglycan-binding protein [Luteimicrobium subarcticum]PJI93400.1 D-alanyl-D-alanine carboxypeptidase-like protein [Luteimicrobium subarcticum]